MGGGQHRHRSEELDGVPGKDTSRFRCTVSTDISLQGKYYSEPYGKPDTESSVARDEAVRNNFWSLCSDLTQEILGERVE